MPTKRDNDEERANRLDQLLEEYRAKTDALHERLQETARGARKVLRQAKARIADNRRHLAGKKR